MTTLHLNYFDRKTGQTVDSDPFVLLVLARTEVHRLMWAGHADSIAIVGDDGSNELWKFGDDGPWMKGQSKPRRRPSQATEEESVADEARVKYPADTRVAGVFTVAELTKLRSLANHHLQSRIRRHPAAQARLAQKQAETGKPMMDVHARSIEQMRGLVEKLDGLIEEAAPEAVASAREDVEVLRKVAEHVRRDCTPAEHGLDGYAVDVLRDVIALVNPDGEDDAE